MLITGGLGFIGSHAAARLVDLGADVSVVDCLAPEYGGNRFNLSAVEGRVKLHIGDVRDADLMSRLIEGQDLVFNLAGQTSHLDSMHNPYADLEINCRAQLSFLESCRRHNPKVKVVFASTRQLYGRPQYLPVDEKHLLQPVDVNGINKMAGEWYHILYNNVYGVRACALRLTNTYGPHMRVRDARQTFLGVWIKQAVEEKRFEVWGGGQLRDFTYVEDAVEALLLAGIDPRADGRIFNLGGMETVSLRALADLLVDACGGGSYAVREFPDEQRKIDIGDYYADWRLIQSALGWRPRIGLAEGLRRTVEFYRHFGQHYGIAPSINESVIDARRA